jgi:hypothetical protein
LIKGIIAVSVTLALITAWTEAQEVKLGVNLSYTGRGAEFAQLVDRGMELYLKLNADEVKPYQITLIKRDVKDPGGANAKIAVQELLTQDNVDILAGWIYSPNAIATSPIVTAGKRRAVIMNAGTAHITNLSPYYVRTSFSMWHAGYAMGEVAAKILNAKTAVVGYPDFPPGKDSLAAFKGDMTSSSPGVADHAAVRALVGRHRLQMWEPIPWVLAIAFYFAFPKHLGFGTEVLITILFALSLDLVLGYPGIVTLGHAAFFGVGAYTVGMLAKHGIWHEPITSLFLTALVAAAVGFGPGPMLLRSHGRRCSC